VRIQIERRGGLAGVTLRADVETTELDSDVAGRVEDALGRLFETPRTPSAAHPDMFEYEIGVPGRGQSVFVGEHDLPDGLRPLVEMLSTRGAIKGAQKRSS